MTADFFVSSCSNCHIFYDTVSGTYRYQSVEDDECVEGFLGLLEILPDRLFG